MFKRSVWVISLMAYSSILLADDSVAKVIKVQGGASAVNDKNETRALERGSDVFSQDTVRTTETGFVTLRFTDGTVIDLASGSKYIIHDYHFNEHEPHKDKFTSQIVEGGFRVITGTIGQRSPTAFEAKAHLTTLTVRGTYFYMMTACPHVIVEKPMPCADVIEFTVNGQTSIKYQNKEYLTGPGTPNTTFNLQGGTVTLTNKIPATLPVIYSTNIQDFPKQVQVTPTSTAPTTPPAGTTTKSSGGGGAAGGSDPCGTLNAVGNALPNVKP